MVHHRAHRGGTEKRLFRVRDKKRAIQNLGVRI
jgi:hypothetical protein